VHPAALPAGSRPHVADGGPQAKRAVTNGDLGGGGHALVSQVAQHLCPRAAVFAVTVDDRAQLLGAVEAYADDDQQTQRVAGALGVGQPHVDVDTVGPHVHIVHRRKVPT